MFYYQSEIFLVFSEFFFSCVVFKNILTLFQNLPTVMRQRQSTLMAKPTNFSRFDKVFKRILGFTYIVTYSNKFHHDYHFLVVLEKAAFTHNVFLNQGFLRS